MVNSSIREELREKIITLEEKLSSAFVGREEEARVTILAVVSKQHAVFIGEPGTAKSALIRRLSQLINCRFFYYLLNKYTVPDELIGPIDPVAYREGRFVRNTKNKLPEAEIVFIDEIFKGSSETLNALLNIMNEREFVDVDGTIYRVPLWSLFGASNEVPTDPELSAFYDRILLRHFVRRIDSSLLEQAIVLNVNNMSNNVEPVLTINDLKRIHDEVSKYMVENINAISKAVARVVVSLREHGIFVSDRTATSPHHFPRLVASYSFIYQADAKISAIEVSKYLLPAPEAYEEYMKARSEMYPRELFEAEKKLEEAKKKLMQGNLNESKTLAREALSILTSFKERDHENYRKYLSEIERVVTEVENLVSKIEALEKQISEIVKPRRKEKVLT